MKKAILACGAMLLIPFGLAACGSDDSSGSSPAAVVDVKNMAFTEKSVTIKPGQTVEWKFDDGGMPHNVASDTGLFKSDLLTSGTYDHTFDKPGKYPYHCDPHPDMTGVVIVAG
ncbi:cupredoxin domain-containing protein [Gordonia sp. DT30]|uniref:cupredoxin domain-containing protein n=1 Tax=unclassified Gordonia (in: high G+C Gram-positive bacteria) TaxID=2657482 RepID=UPI003CFA0BAE